MMLKHSARYGIIAVILVVAVLLQPWWPVASLIFAQDPGGNKVYLPIILKAPPPPDFAIISPISESTISGFIYFAVQPTEQGSISSVNFRAGSTDLGTATPRDGFRVLLDASKFAVRKLQLSATATGPGGQKTKTIAVQVLPNPPSSGTIGSRGGVLASETGSIITIPPGAVPDGTTVSVTEKSQQQITEETGITWQDPEAAFLVTFLGAQEIQSSANFSKPLGVASADFGQQVQPGQAVVNYRIMPDADGDGQDELVVVNTASVKLEDPKDPDDKSFVISDPVPQISIHSIKIISRLGTSSLSALNDGISGSTGTRVEINVSGKFSPFAINDNVAVWTSLVNSHTFTIPLYVPLVPLNSPEQIVSTVIPPLPPGPAKLTLRNERTNSSSEELVDVTIEPPLPLSRPAREVINEFLGKTGNFLENMPTARATEEVYKNTAVDRFFRARSNIERSMDQIPEQELNDVASTIENMDIFRTDREFLNVISDIGMYAHILQLAALVIPPLAPLGPAASLISNITTLVSYAVLVCAGERQGPCFGREYALPIDVPLDILTIPFTWSIFYGSGGGGGGMSTGMGAAPLQGGNGAGDVLFGETGGSSLRAHSLSQQPGRVIVKVFSSGSSIPFSGMTDAGGYFFIPLIPEGSFTAIAFDLTTGECRTFDGTSPAIGGSVFLFFDFTDSAGCSLPPTIRWDGGGDGLTWGDPNNWDLNRIPGPQDRVAIVVTGTITVTHANSTTTIVSLQSEEAIEMSGGSLTISAPSQVNNAFTMSQGATLIANGSVATFTANGPTTIDNGAQLSALGGGVIRLPSLISYTSQSVRVNELKAIGAGSLLDLSAVTTLHGAGLGTLSIQALNGGRIDFSSVTEIIVGGNSGHVNISAERTGSVVDFSALERFNGSIFSGLIKASEGGTISFNPGTTTVEGVDIELTTDGILSVGTLELSTNSHFGGAGTIAANIINNGGTVCPGVVSVGCRFTAEMITIDGTYTQNVSGTLRIQLGGLNPGLEFDRLNITGSAAFDGTLDVELLNGFSPNSGDSFQVITFGSHNGAFATINGNGQSYTANLNATDLTLVVQ